MINRFIENKKLAGANRLIWKNGQIIKQESLGFKNLTTKELLTNDSIFRISSMTKPITSVIAMMLKEEYKFELDTPISTFLPQFKNLMVIKDQYGNFEKAKSQITILDLLTHRAGFTYSEFQQGKFRDEYRKLGGDIDSELTQNQWLDTLAQLPLVNHPGEWFNYGRSTDLLGILISVIEQKPLSKVMSEKLFNPLGMTDTFFDVPESKISRCVSNIGYNEIGEVIDIDRVPLNMAMKVRPENLEYQSGGQGLWSTIGDYLKFAMIFTESGSPNGVKILSKESINLMTQNQLSEIQKAKAQLLGAPIFNNDYGFGLGLAIVTNENKYSSIPCSGTIGTVGWPGAYGGWWSADPINKTISIFLTHSMTEPSQLEQGIGFELYEAIDKFSNYSKEMN